MQGPPWPGPGFPEAPLWPYWSIPLQGPGRRSLGTERGPKCSSGDRLPCTPKSSSPHGGPSAETPSVRPRSLSIQAILRVPFCAACASEVLGQGCDGQNPTSTARYVHILTHTDKIPTNTYIYIHIQTVVIQNLRHALTGRLPQLSVHDAHASRGRVAIRTIALPLHTFVAQFGYLTSHVLEPVYSSMCQYRHSICMYLKTICQYHCSICKD